MKLVRVSASLVMSACILTAAHPRASARSTRRFNMVEATISQIHAAIRSGDLTCRALVDRYLERIRAYDQSTRLNAIVVVNREAPADADRLDQEFKRTGRLRPLHGIPVIVKDN